MNFKALEVVIGTVGLLIGLMLTGHTFVSALLYITVTFMVLSIFKYWLK